MWELLAKWTPEEIVGFMVALGVVLGAYRVKGVAKPKSVPAPTIDASGMLHHAALAPLDRMVLERVLDGVNELKRDLKEVHSDVSVIRRDTERANDRLELIMKNPP
jgi:hypothetical protein